VQLVVVGGGGVGVGVGVGVGEVVLVRKVSEDHPEKSVVIVNKPPEISSVVGREGGYGSLVV